MSRHHGRTKSIANEKEKERKDEKRKKKLEGEELLKEQQKTIETLINEISLAREKIGEAVKIIPFLMKSLPSHNIFFS